MPLVLLLLAGALLAACAAPAPVSRSERPIACDDGGDGGVVIHGVCL
jgi:hypothetical protein